MMRDRSMISDDLRQRCAGMSYQRQLQRHPIRFRRSRRAPMISMSEGSKV
jgi:hypothetical protein